jgi:hypothetical protein
MVEVPTIELSRLVVDIAAALTQADGRRPAWVSRSRRAYQAGIGPHAENAAVALMLDELRQVEPYRSIPLGQFLAYPEAPRQKCDLWLGAPVEWAIEVKMARFKGDNGKPDDTAIKDLLSPYEADRSALADTLKLARSEITAQKAVLIYGFDAVDRQLEPAIAAFETLARARVRLGERNQAALGALVHPIHASGAVYAWEIGPAS